MKRLSSKKIWYVLLVLCCAHQLHAMNFITNLYKKYWQGITENPWIELINAWQPTSETALEALLNKAATIDVDINAIAKLHGQTPLQYALAKSYFFGREKYEAALGLLFIAEQRGLTINPWQGSSSGFLTIQYALWNLEKNSRPELLAQHLQAPNNTFNTLMNTVIAQITPLRPDDRIPELQQQPLHMVQQNTNIDQIIPALQQQLLYMVQRSANVLAGYIQHLESSKSAAEHQQEQMLLQQHHEYSASYAAEKPPRLPIIETLEQQKTALLAIEPTLKNIAALIQAITNPQELIIAQKLLVSLLNSPLLKAANPERTQTNMTLLQHWFTYFNAILARLHGSEIASADFEPVTAYDDEALDEDTWTEDEGEIQEQPVEQPTSSTRMQPEKRKTAEPMIEQPIPQTVRAQQATPEQKASTPVPTTPVVTTPPSAAQLTWKSTIDEFNKLLNPYTESAASFQRLKQEIANLSQSSDIDGEYPELDNLTPLQYALLKGSNFTAARLLLKYGADPYAYAWLPPTPEDFPLGGETVDSYEFAFFAALFNPHLNEALSNSTAVSLNKLHRLQDWFDLIKNLATTPVSDEVRYNEYLNLKYNSELIKNTKKDLPINLKFRATDLDNFVAEIITKTNAAKSIIIKLKNQRETINENLKSIKFLPNLSRFFVNMHIIGVLAHYFKRKYPTVNLGNIIAGIFDFAEHRTRTMLEEDEQLLKQYPIE